MSPPAWPQARRTAKMPYPAVVLAGLLQAGALAWAGPWEATTPEGWTVRITQDSFRERDAYLLERLYRDGTPDAGFGRNGSTAFVLGPDNEGPAALRGDAVGRWWVAGASVGTDNLPKAVVLRFLAQGVPDTSYAVAGRSAVAPAGRSARALDLLPQADGTSWVAGLVVDAQGNERSGWWRLRADGSVDPAFGLGGLWQDGAAGATEVVNLAAGVGAMLALGLRRGQGEAMQLEVWQLAPGAATPTLAEVLTQQASGGRRLVWREGQWRWLDSADRLLPARPAAAATPGAPGAATAAARPAPPALPAIAAAAAAPASTATAERTSASWLVPALLIALIAALAALVALRRRQRR